MEKKNTSALRIALIGPESTAKSTLSEKLAKHYHTLWVPEYSRIYLKELKRNYTLDDILLIAKEQFKQVKMMLRAFGDRNFMLVYPAGSAVPVRKRKPSNAWARHPAPVRRPLAPSVAARHPP